jgi:dihydroneopterin aldolase/2-amino-4-hydroxy-6-hydroxymethyldihydropteridine diphosphokinase
VADRIELNGIRVVGVVGALPEERRRAQLVEVDLVIDFDARPAGGSDELADSVDYGLPVGIVDRVLSTEQPRLLERAAERIAEEVLGLPAVEAVEVVVRKLHVPVPHDVGSAAVRVRRARAGRAAPARPASTAYIGMGSNLGDRRALLSFGVRQLETVTAVSPLYESDPVGGPVQGPYLNLVVQLSTTMDPFQLLERCLAIEHAAGRERRERWGPRTLDLDLLLFEGVELRSPRLTVPHPRMWERRFVLQPLADIAPALLPPDWDDRLPPAGVTRVDDLEL